METLTTNENLKIHHCSVKDIKTLSDVAQYAYKQHYMHIWEQNKDFYIDLSFSVEAITKDFQDANILYFLINLDGANVGIMKINQHKKLKQYADEEALEIEKIYLKDEAAGKGVGTKAIEFIIDYAKKLNKKVVWLNVMTTSRAYHFYLKLGFEPVGIYYLDYKDLKNEYREMLTMKMIL